MTSPHAVDARGSASSAASPSTPRWPVIARTQFRTVGMAVRRELAVAGSVLLLVAIPMLVRHVSTPGHSSDMQFAQVTLLASLVGLFAPMAVWRGEGPSRRSYFWTLPVDRFQHTLLRVGTGWVWLVVAVAGIVLWAAALASLTGGELSMHDTHILVREVAEGVAPTPDDYVQRAWPVAAWQWLVPFTVATTMYLLASAVVVASDRPWRWFALLAFGVVIVLVTEIAWAQQALAALVYGSQGLLLLATGGSRQPVPIEVPGGGRVRVVALVPALVPWLQAVATWLVPASVAVLVAARRYREER